MFYMNSVNIGWIQIIKHPNLSLLPAVRVVLNWHRNPFKTGSFEPHDWTPEEVFEIENFKETLNIWNNPFIIITK